MTDLSKFDTPDLEAEIRRRKQEPVECMGEGNCHGCLVWCDKCGDTSEMCNDPTCDFHCRETSETCEYRDCRFHDGDDE